MERLNEQTWDLLMKRFDTIEAQNKAQLDLMAHHIELDEKVHQVVTRHSTYFKILSAGIPAGIGILVTKLGWK